MLELLNKFNDEYKWYIFQDIKYNLAGYYYDQNNFDSSIKYIRNILKEIMLTKNIFGKKPLEKKVYLQKKIEPYKKRSPSKKHRNPIKKKVYQFLFQNT